MASFREIDEETLKAANFDAKTLYEQGFSAKALRAVWFDPDQLKDAGIPAISLRVAGFNCDDLREGGYDAAEAASAGFTHEQLRRGGYDAVDMKETLKLTAGQCKTAGYGARDLKRVGFLAAELKEAGFSATELGQCCNPTEMSRAGFEKEVLKPLGYWKHDGEWQYYNQYWSSCHSLEGESIYCVALKERQRSNNPIN